MTVLVKINIERINVFGFAQPGEVGELHPSAAETPPVDEVLNATRETFRAASYASAKSFAPRFVKLGNDDEELSEDATEWSQVLDKSTGLIWSADTVGDRVNWQTAKNVAADITLGAASNEWRLATLSERLTISDFERCDPAINTTFFRGKGNEWTSTPLASSPADCAWNVLFHGGFAVYDAQNGAAFVRAVRSARASQ